MKKIKILYTIPNFDTAGSGKVLYDLANGLNKEQFDVSIACKNSNGAFFEEIKKLGLPIYFIDTTTALRPYYSFYSRVGVVKKFFKEHKFDIIHSWHWSSDWSEVVAAKLSGAKFVYTKKAMSWGNVHWKIRSYLSDFIITINDEMSNYFPNKKAQQLIPLGLDVDYYSPKHSEAKAEGIFKVITVANLVPVKGIEVLINAIHLLNNPNIFLEVLGDDRSDYAQELKQLVVNLNLSNTISFLGKHTDVRPFVENSNLYIIPTLNSGRKEGMPMALVEAMSMSTPVLGSDITGINFVLKDFKEYLFEPENSEMLSKKINHFYSMSGQERNDVGRSLREYCLANFTIEKFVNQHQELYSKLIKK